MNSLNLNITPNDWDSFEQMYGLTQMDVIEVKNRYRHPARLFVERKQLYEYDRLDELINKPFECNDDLKIRTNYEKELSNMIYQFPVSRKWIKHKDIYDLNT